jgi:hypothetical protein
MVPFVTGFVSPAVLSTTVSPPPGDEDLQAKYGNDTAQSREK